MQTDSQDIRPRCGRAAAHHISNYHCCYSQKPLVVHAVPREHFHQQGVADNLPAEPGQLLHRPRAVHQHCGRPRVVAAGPGQAQALRPSRADDEPAALLLRAHGAAGEVGQSRRCQPCPEVSLLVLPLPVPAGTRQGRAQGAKASDPRVRVEPASQGGC